MITAPSFSVVICTDARLDFLSVTLDSLRHLSHQTFEVCLVCGPTKDGTRDYAAGYGRGLKIAHCESRNLSKARNIGIAMAAGDIVAFLDDDAVPEPEWLDQLALSFGDPDVGAAGGFVYDNTGVKFQAKYVTINRLGYPNEFWSEPAPHMNFAYSPEFPHLLGANCSFRREILLELGGFDEEFEYFLDETDLCCRLNDAGYKIDQRSDAFVHHKFAPSSIRDHRKVISDWYSLIKNRVYFAMRNGRYHHSVRDIVGAGLKDIESWEQAVRRAVASGVQRPEALERFFEQAEAAMAEGLAAGRRARRKLLTARTLAENHSAFTPFSTLLPLAERLVICMVTQDYPPGQNGGIARNVSQLARGLARLGHRVHVLTRARGPAAVDFEQQVWVHRIDIRRQPPPPSSLISPFVCPPHIWDYSRTMLQEVQAIDARKRVDFVYCPLWDCEPIAFLVDGAFPMVCALQTTMKFWLESQSRKAADRHWMRAFGLPIIAMEEFIIAHAWLLHANSRAIVEDIEKKYEIEIDRERVFVCPHGMEDWAAPARSMDEFGRDEGPRLLFVGRLESRKGIDVLWEAALPLLRAFPEVSLDIVGDDTIPRWDGKTYKQAFLEQHAEEECLAQIRFHGRVGEEELRGFYRDCDIFVAPSRYESFGLIYLEAMIFGKPVVATAVGGIPEVVVNGVTGLLTPPGVSESLRLALERLIEDRELRLIMGRAGRARYEAQFTEAAMCENMLDFIRPRLTRSGDARDFAVDKERALLNTGPMAAAGIAGPAGKA